MNDNFTKELGAWLSANPNDRDWPKGAQMLLQLNRNQIMYRRLLMNLDSAKNREIIEYYLRKYHNQRVGQATHAEVEAMQAQVNDIIAKRPFLAESPDKGLKSGKRADHDSLPDEIQAMYVENLSLMQRMRELHTRLRIISNDKSGQYCPDSDRYPLLKELITLDKQYRDNWHAYDTYDIVRAESTMDIDARAESARCQRLVNLNKGKYAKNPNETLAAQIRDWYSHIINPTERLTRELTELGII